MYSTEPACIRHWICLHLSAGLSYLAMRARSSVECAHELRIYPSHMIGHQQEGRFMEVCKGVYRTRSVLGSNSIRTRRTFVRSFVNPRARINPSKANSVVIYCRHARPQGLLCSTMGTSSPDAHRDEVDTHPRHNCHLKCSNYTNDAPTDLLSRQAEVSANPL
ncbi:hypothetical protein BD779DRAFT_1169694 [Infundibulicybe gibba]|nr:hypothetical protein BD779DRAFT_1169694 [Infundibulicybe gibba]